MGSNSLIGSVPDNWEIATLGEVCERGGGNIQTGPFGSQLHASDYVAVGIPSIMPQNIGDNRISENGIARISPEDAERLNKYLVREGDIVYSRRGDVERRALIRKNEDGWLCGTGCLRIRLGESGPNPIFTAHYLGHPNVREWIVRHAHGATMPNLNTSILSALPFVVPPRKMQEEVAETIETFDQKLEVNRRMNETLEAMARALFKSWFVDFTPVHAKAAGRKPEGMDAQAAALFPDSFQDSPLGKIPKGWSVCEIRERTSAIQYGLTQSANKERVGPHFLRITDIQGGRVNWETVPFTQIPIEEEEKYRIRKNDIFVARTGASTGENVFIYDAPNAVFASYLVRFQFENPSIARLVGMFMRTPAYFEHIAGILGGSAQPNASAQALASCKMIFPTDEIANRFSRYMMPMDAAKYSNELQMGTLKNVRDTLLPKLLSGEITTTVKEVL